MSNHFYSFSAVLFLFLVSLTHSQKLTIEDGYSIQFTSKNPSGVFEKLMGDIYFDEHNLPQSSFNIKIDAASINTGNALKNKHAKSKKWLDVLTYPSITFKSTSIKKSGSKYVTTGILSMHGVARTVKIPFTYTNNKFKGSFTINRLDYNIGNSKGMNALAATDLKIDISVPVSN